MKLNHKDEVISLLQKKMLEQTSKLVSYYIVDMSNDDEAKKTAEAAMFMESLLSGKMKDKDAPFIEKHKDIFKIIHSYSDDIKKISK